MTYQRPFLTEMAFFYAYFELLEKRPTIISIMATVMAKSAAVQNPDTSNLSCIIESVNRIIKTVIIKEIRPNVKKFKGNVNRRKIPPMVALTNPIISPVTIAHPKPATCTPGVIQEASAMTIPVVRSEIINFIGMFFLIILRKIAFIFVTNNKIAV